MAGLGLALAIVQEQALAAGPTSLPQNGGELKAWFSSLLLRHPAGGIVLGVVVVAWMVLSQAQNIEAGFRLLRQFFHHLFGHSRKPQEPQPPPLEPLRPINVTIQHPPAPPVPQPASVATSALTNLPPARSGFVARTSELDQLATDLAPAGARVVLHGLPGVGKTTLALHYANTARASYPGGVWWLDASEGFEPMALRAVSELEACISGLGSADGLSLEARLRRCFQAWPGGEEEPILLIADNLPPSGEGMAMERRLTTGLPRRFRFVLTQRALPLQSTAEMKVPVLASADALELLKIRSGERGRRRIEQELEQARRLVEAVDGLPLALVLLGARLKRVPTLSTGDLLEDLAQAQLEAAAFSNDHAELLMEPGMVATMLTSWHTVRPKAQELARLLSLTLPAPIPWELIERCVPSGPPNTPQPVNRYWEDALAELVGANLLDAQDADRPLYALHPLVRQFFSLQRRGWRPEPHWRRELGATAQVLANGCQGVDLPRSVDYWRQATHADPADAAAAYGLGYGLIPLGDSEGARQAFAQSQRNAEAANDPRGVSCALNGIGDVLVFQGDGPGALAAYQAGLTIREDLAKRDPANTQWQRDLSVSHNKMGDVLVSQGDGPGALAAYQAGLTIAEDLAKRDPANTQWQRDLSVSHNKMGDVLVSQGDGPGALAAYQAALTIREGLAKRDLANTQWQVDVAVSCSKLGTMNQLLPVSTRRVYLQRGREILIALKQARRLHSNQDYTDWFDEQIQRLDRAR